MNPVVTLPLPHNAQATVLGSPARFRVLMCGRRWGKSLISQSEAITTALNGQLVAYITPTYGLAKVFFEEICKRVPTTVAVPNKADLTLHFITGGVVRFFTGERLDNLRGHRFHLVIIDEASYIPGLLDGWNNSIRPTLTDFQGRALFLSTPKGKNFFYSLYMRGEAQEPSWQSFRFPTSTNPYIAPDELVEAQQQLPGPVFAQEYLAEPAENADNPFGGPFIKACIFPQSSFPPIVFGIDLAKSTDYTVMIGLDKFGNVCHFERFQQDWNTTKQAIINLPRVPLVIDATGVGDPIVEDVQRSGHDAIAFKFTSSSKQELMLGLSSAIQQKKVGYPEGPITQELEIFEYQYTATGVKYSAPLGFHDDCVMALALAWRGYTRHASTGFVVYE